MRKVLLFLGLITTLVNPVFAVNDSIVSLNTELVKILAPYQNDTTAAQLIFNTIETNEQHALNLSLNAYYRKIGEANTLELKVDNFGYADGDGSAPTTTLKGSVGFDLSQYLSQDEFNLFAANINFFMKQIADVALSLDNYGQAAAWNSVITSTTMDNDGNYIGRSVLTSVKIDLSKLPENTKSSQVLATEIVLAMDINKKSGLNIDAYVVNNPDSWEFNAFANDMKEILDKLIALDKGALYQITGFVKILDQFSTEYVSKGQDDVNNIRFDVHQMIKSIPSESK